MTLDVWSSRAYKVADRMVNGHTMRLAFAAAAIGLSLSLGSAAN